jgi:hypothetical protein
MLGYAREDTWDLPIDKVITGMSNQMFEHLKRNLAENHHILIDARCFRQDGTSFAGEVGVSTLSLTRGSNIVFAIRNVDRRKNAMDEMRKGQAALEVVCALSSATWTGSSCVHSGAARLLRHSDEAQAKKCDSLTVAGPARSSCGRRAARSCARACACRRHATAQVELSLKLCRTARPHGRGGQSFRLTTIAQRKNRVRGGLALRAPAALLDAWQLEGLRTEGLNRRTEGRRARPIRRGRGVVLEQVEPVLHGR